MATMIPGIYDGTKVGSEKQENEIIREVDQALKAQQPESEDPLYRKDRANEEKAHSLTSMLRKVALVVLMTAAGTFLFQGWSGWNSVERILAFVGFVGALGATGAVCGFRYKDTKGARVSLGIATAVIPVAFSQTGGLIYSLGGTVPNGIPELLKFTAPSISAALITLAVVIGALGPIAYAGFSVLARSEAPVLTALYLIGNTALLLPTRDPMHVGLLAMGLVALTMFIDMTRFHRRAEVRTLEGGISRAMMFVPFAILVVRNLALYSVSTILVSCLFAVAASFFFFVIPQIAGDDLIAKRSQAVSTVPAALSWICFAQALFFEYGAPFTLSHDYIKPVEFLPVAAILTVMSLFTVGSGSNYRRSAAFLAVGTMFLQLLTVPGVVSAFLCILTSIVCLGAGCVMEEKGLLNAGCVGLFLGVVYHLRYAIGIFQGLGPWVSLAILGIVVLILSSYIEKNYRAILQKVAVYKQELKTWK